MMLAECGQLLTKGLLDAVAAARHASGGDSQVFGNTGANSAVLKIVLQPLFVQSAAPSHVSTHHGALCCAHMCKHALKCVDLQSLQCSSVLWAWWECSSEQSVHFGCLTVRQHIFLLYKRLIAIHLSTVCSQEQR